MKRWTGRFGSLMFAGFRGRKSLGWKRFIERRRTTGWPSSLGPFEPKAGKARVFVTEFGECYFRSQTCCSSAWLRTALRKGTASADQPPSLCHFNFS